MYSGHPQMLGFVLVQGLLAGVEAVGHVPEADLWLSGLERIADIKLCEFARPRFLLPMLRTAVVCPHSGL